MLVKPPIEDLLPHVDNRYVLSILAAKRARQLVDGAQPMAEIENQSMVTVAASELADDKVRYLEGRIDVEIPLRPEVQLEQLLAEQGIDIDNFGEDSLDMPRFSEIDDVLTEEIADQDDAKRIAEQLMAMVNQEEDEVLEPTLPISELLQKHGQPQDEDFDEEE